MKYDVIDTQSKAFDGVKSTPTLKGLKKLS